jgi:5-(carboxyamino)imidazole ribonucleotide synthase
MKNVCKTKLGIIGGGQLGKMMILEAKRLGLYVITLDPSADCPSSSVSDELITADFLRDEDAIRRLAEKSDVITYESEHINTKVLTELEAQGHTIYPPVSSLRVIQDKFLQKEKLFNSGMRVPVFAKIEDAAQLRGFAEKHGYPVMLKTRREGYDGKGNFTVRDEAGIEAGFAALKGELMAEEFIDYSIEVSVIAVRGIRGEKAVYPIPHNEHKNSTLDTSAVPADLPEKLKADVIEAAGRVMEIFDGVGTFGVEMFVGRDGLIYINEAAPRPHNSGHYTIEGCRVNQFENHIRAILGLPLGSTELLHGAVIMRNLLGQGNGAAKVCGTEEAYRLSDRVNIHVYGKSESRTARKMGHYTVTADSMEKARETDAMIAGVVRITGE